MKSATPPTVIASSPTLPASPMWAGASEWWARARDAAAGAAVRLVVVTAPDCRGFLPPAYTPADAVRAARRPSNGSVGPHLQLARVPLRRRAGGAGHLPRLRRLRGIPPAGRSSEPEHRLPHTGPHGLAVRGHQLR